MKGLLVLEDGTGFEGSLFGAKKEAIGEVIINTAVVGYQEMMTDPANAGKILVFTYPLIGNYGINERFSESIRAWTSGIAVKEQSRIYSNFQAKTSLEDFLKKEDIPAIVGVDTRTLAVKLRDDGEMLGIISAGKSGIKQLQSTLREFKKNKRQSMLSSVSTKKTVYIEGKGKRVAVVDLGGLKGFISQISGMGFEVVIVPYDTTAADILKLKPKGIVISSGPENDPGISPVINAAKGILGKVPVLGISLGHQVIAQALGARLTKMKLGHRGVNYPVKRQGTNKGEITVQNHSFSVDEKSLKERSVEITERNLNDKTIEKLKSKKLKFVSVQYYPVSPGSGEINPLFGEFKEMIDG